MNRIGKSNYFSTALVRAYPPFLLLPILCKWESLPYVAKFVLLLRAGREVQSDASLAAPLWGSKTGRRLSHGFMGWQFRFSRPLRQREIRTSLYGVRAVEKGTGSREGVDVGETVAARALAKLARLAFVSMCSVEL